MLLHGRCRLGGKEVGTEEGQGVSTAWSDGSHPGATSQQAQRDTSALGRRVCLAGGTSLDRVEGGIILSPSWEGRGETLPRHLQFPFGWSLPDEMFTFSPFLASSFGLRWAVRVRTWGGGLPPEEWTEDQPCSCVSPGLRSGSPGGEPSFSRARDCSVPGARTIQIRVDTAGSRATETVGRWAPLRRPEGCVTFVSTTVFPLLSWVY